MTFLQSDTVRYFTFSSLAIHNLTHAVFTRHGGVSPSPWYSLNLGATVGDSATCVLENRQRAFHAVHCEYDTLFDVWQVHSDVVVTTDSPRLPGNPYQRADAILTDSSNVTLMMRFADCVPILLYDPHREVVGLVHAGWLGTVKGVVVNAIQAMQLNYHSQPADIIAAIGPSIGPDHYLVGADVIHQVNQVFGVDASGLFRQSTQVEPGKAYFDLWQANQRLLEKAGVHQIEIARICTACNLSDWYSHRAESGRTGRFGAIIKLGRDG